MGLASYDYGIGYVGYMGIGRLGGLPFGDLYSSLVR